MIAKLVGEIQNKTLEGVTVMAGNVGYFVYLNAQTLQEMIEGDQACLYTYLAVREDSMTLYGFTSIEQKNTFEILLKARKVGPKLALTALNILNVDQLKMAVKEKNFTLLQKIPGVGRRLAESMVVDLDNKLGSPSVASTTTLNNLENIDVQERVVEALVSLGWQNQEAQKAVNRIYAPNMEQSALLRAALLDLGANRG